MNNAEAQVSLRSDLRISELEKAAKHNEPKRIEDSQLLKAAGSSADTYTEDELKRISWWCFSTPKTPREIHTHLRDRAMVLWSAATAFRGNSARILLWSDLYTSKVPMHELGMGRTVPVRLTIYPSRSFICSQVLLPSSCPGSCRSCKQLKTQSIRAVGRAWRAATSFSGALPCWRPCASLLCTLPYILCAQAQFYTRLYGHKLRAVRSSSLVLLSCLLRKRY